MKTSLYVGRVSHTRLLPRRHGFRYWLCMILLDLDEMDASPGTLGKWWRWLLPLRKRDHLKSLPDTDSASLRQRLCKLVQSRMGWTPDGRIYLLTGFGFLWQRFNPVSFYYCQDDKGDLACLVAEVTNTPWKEQFYYVLDARPQQGQKRLHFACDKDFHVSPFMPMDTRYRWTVTVPNEDLSVLIDIDRGDRHCFNASLQLQALPVTGRNLIHCLLRQPLMSLQVSVSIYWQALRLWLKKIPFFPHPKHL